MTAAPPAERPARAGPGPPARHDWATLRAGWASALAAPLAAAERAALEAWDPARRPLVVARAHPEDGEGAVRLGLALPGRVRIGVLVSGAAIATRAPPLALEAVLPGAPAAWREPLARLAADLRGAGVPARVFGSLAWQHVAGDPALAYVTASSDADLLVAPRRWEEAEHALALLGGFAGPPRLDGEVLVPGGGAVAWRELASGAERVLVKDRAGAALVAVSALRAGLGR